MGRCAIGASRDIPVPRVRGRLERRQCVARRRDSLADRDPPCGVLLRYAVKGGKSSGVCLSPVSASVLRHPSPRTTAGGPCKRLEMRVSPCKEVHDSPHHWTMDRAPSGIPYDPTGSRAQQRRPRSMIVVIGRRLHFSPSPRQRDKRPSPSGTHRAMRSREAPTPPRRAHLTSTDGKTPGLRANEWQGVG